MPETQLAQQRAQLVERQADDGQEGAVDARDQAGGVAPGASRCDALRGTAGRVCYEGERARSSSGSARHPGLDRTDIATGVTY